MDLFLHKAMELYFKEKNKTIIHFCHSIPQILAKNYCEIMCDFHFLSIDIYIIYIDNMTSINIK